jgi:cyclic pyranopterin monophosphate synthase
MSSSEGAPQNQGKVPSASESLTHVNERGEARMVDVGGKEISRRSAVATSRVTMSSVASEAIQANSIKKGDCISVARIAAIQAAKQTSFLIPLCHAIPIDSVHVEHTWISINDLEFRVVVKSTGTTGVEMEALTAATIAALTVYDMCKAIDRSMTISQIKLLEKTGGVRGDYFRNE